jgi:hypothetical protein
VPQLALRHLVAQARHKQRLVGVTLQARQQRQGRYRLQPR